MSGKQKINPFILSRLNPHDLWSRLVNLKKAPQVAIFDLDGTLHKGFCYQLWKGLSNIDLSLWLGALLLKKPLQFSAYVRRLLNFKRKLYGDGLWRNHRVEYGAASGEIQKFIEEVLKGVPYSDIKRAAAEISRLHFSDAPFCVRRIAENSQRCALVSRALYPVLEAYAKRFQQARDLKFSIYGNVLTSEDGRIGSLDPERRILTEADKRAVVLKLLIPLRDHGHTIIFGNGHEDLGMFEIADDILGSEHALKIAIKPRSDMLAAKADVVVASWKGLKQVLLLSGRQHHAARAALLI